VEMVGVRGEEAKVGVRVVEGSAVGEDLEDWVVVAMEVG